MDLFTERTNEQNVHDFLERELLKFGMTMDDFHICVFPGEVLTMDNAINAIEVLKSFNPGKLGGSPNPSLAYAGEGFLIK